MEHEGIRVWADPGTLAVHLSTPFLNAHLASLFCMLLARRSAPLVCTSEKSRASTFIDIGRLERDRERYPWRTDQHECVPQENNITNLSRTNVDDMSNVSMNMR